MKGKERRKEKERRGKEKRGEKRRGEKRRGEGLSPVEVAGLLHFGTGDLQSDTLRALSPPFLKTVWMAAETKLAFSAAQGPSQFYFRPLLSDTGHSAWNTRNAKRVRTIKFGGDGREAKRGDLEKEGGGFVKGLTVVSPSPTHYQPSSRRSFLPLDGTAARSPPTYRSAVPRPTQHHYLSPDFRSIT